VHRSRDDLAGCAIADVIAPRGKELWTTDTVAAARRLLAKQAVQVVPVLDGSAYVGAVDRAAVGDDVPADTPVVAVASRFPPTATASTPAADALAVLDDAGAKRLVVLADDDATYVGLVCIRGDRRRLCVDARTLTPANERTHSR
jgi:CBS-domain-containing membrane protein